MVIEVEHLVKGYGPIKAVDDISFQVMPGGAFGMLGPICRLASCLHDTGC